MTANNFSNTRYLLSLTSTAIRAETSFTTGQEGVRLQAKVLDYVSSWRTQFTCTATTYIMHHELVVQHDEWW